jgi:hypothetical protein
MTDWRETYFNRVRPVLGEAFGHARLVFWNLDYSAHIAEALARTGYSQQMWFDEALAGSEFCQSFGQGYVGSDRKRALGEFCVAHNGFEENWQISHEGLCLDTLSRALRANQAPDLLIASIDRHAGKVLRLAINNGIPVLLSLLPRGASVGALQIVWVPETNVDVDVIIEFVDTLAILAETMPDSVDFSEHLDLLECSSLGLSLARWLLNADRPVRDDLRRPMVDDGRCIVVRGAPGWPWTTRFCRPPGQRAGNEGNLLALLNRKDRTYRPPARLWGRERILVIGLGTGSLFAQEAPLLGKHLCLIDCKEVSPFNPVRQAFDSQDIGRFKGQALAEIIAKQRARNARITRKTNGALTTLVAGDHHLSYAKLCANREDSNSLRDFQEIVDAFQPTVGIVAMGRSKDDNFAVAEILRKRSIRHITPTAFPGVSHFKHIVTDGGKGPCYDCLQGHLAIDGGRGPSLQPSEREMFYGGTQPATLAETLPSAHSLLRLTRDLALPHAARPPYLQRELNAERCTFVGANRTEEAEHGWLYGMSHPFTMVTYGIEDLVGSRAEQRCPCGRVNRVRHQFP